MPLDSVADVVANLGAPIGIAVVLIWHVLWANRALARQNSRLVDQLAELSLRIQALESVRTNLADLMDRVGTEQQLKEQLAVAQSDLVSERQQSRDLLQQFVDYQLGVDHYAAPARPEITSAGSSRSFSHFTVQIEDDIATVRFAREQLLNESVIQGMGEELSKLVDSTPNIKLLLAFAEVRHTNSAGLGMLMTVLNRVRKRGGHMVLCGIRPQMYEVFQITKLSRLFDIFDTEAEARAALRSA